MTTPTTTQCPKCGAKKRRPDKEWWECGSYQNKGYALLKEGCVVEPLEFVESIWCVRNQRDQALHREKALRDALLFTANDAGLCISSECHENIEKALAITGREETNE